MVCVSARRNMPAGTIGRSMMAPLTLLSAGGSPQAVRCSIERTTPHCAHVHRRLLASLVVQALSAGITAPLTAKIMTRTFITLLLGTPFPPDSVREEVGLQRPSAAV